MTDLTGLTITPELNKKLMLLTASLLEEYEERLGNDGCNDWEFPEDWTKEQALELTNLYVAVTADSGEFEEYEFAEGEVIDNNISVVWLLRTILTGAAEAL